jgi:hypothetical protein
MEIVMNVGVAVTVPVNILPLLDDTDFKTRETAVAYNAAGMDLVWNFVTRAGVQTQTAVTPTTAGDYDWTHKGDGMYNIEIPASGGASINNNAEGYGWFTGVATGVLPWRGPIIQFENDHFYRATKTVIKGTVGTGSTTTSVVTSSLSPAAALNSFNGQNICFDRDTTTAALRGQKGTITATAADGTLTIQAAHLTTAPANGDTFTIQ